MSECGACEIESVCRMCDDDADDGDSLSGAKLTKVQSPPPPSSHRFLFTFAPGCAILCPRGVTVHYVLITASCQFHFVDDNLVPDKSPFV